MQLDAPSCSLAQDSCLSPLIYSLTLNLFLPSGCLRMRCKASRRQSSTIIFEEYHGTLTAFFMHREAEDITPPTEELFLLRQLITLNKEGLRVKEMGRWGKKKSIKVKDGLTANTCSSPALPLLLLYFHCAVRVELPPCPVHGPAAPSLVSCS